MLKKPSKQEAMAALGLQGEEAIPSDYQSRDEILVRAFRWCEKNVNYVPLDIEDDISASYAEDTLEEFEKTVRKWLEALREAEKERGAA